MLNLHLRTLLLSALASILLALAPWGTCRAADNGGRLKKGFLTPPADARPWVYWFWLNGNITRQGITADLEAMQRAGIGGVLIMEVDQGTPAGPMRFGSPAWRDLFKFVCAEAHRLGLKVNMNNDAGWCGSGGPWITPALAMQKVTWTETRVQGPRHFAAQLPQPATVDGFYRDIAVLAFPTPAQGATISNLAHKSAATSSGVSLTPPISSWPAVPAEATVSHARLVDLTSHLTNDGRLTWDVPEGKWTILRMGHTPTGAVNAPAPKDARGLECDKLSRQAAEAQFAGLMAKLIGDVGPLAGKTLVSTHIDSWEVGVQNWTPGFRQEFQRRRGYDPLPLLPVMAGHVVDSDEVSERFLWDLRETISELLLANYAGHFHELAHQHGLRLSIEAYNTCPCDEMAYGGRADEPMGEFWSWSKYGAAFSCTEMASAGHVYGKRIIGAEAFTATDAEKWQGYPGNIKDLGDWAFCEGINRFVFHRYALQPWLNRRPGMSMGPWGLHYERTETWWEQSKAWHEYLARCQFLLRQGLFVADLCLLGPEGSPQSLNGQQSFVSHQPGREGQPLDRPGHNFDTCPPEVVLTRMSVKDGRLVLPDGMSYRMLVLPQVDSMTPALLAKIKQLVAEGATIAGPRPKKSPSLSNYPQCDATISRQAAELWGAGQPPAEITEHTYGKGRVFWGGALQPKPEFAATAAKAFRSARWIWYREGNPAVAAPRGKRYFRRIVNIDGRSPIQSARLAMTADNGFVCWINGQRAGSGDNYNRVYTLEVASLLKPGANLLAIRAENGGEGPNPAGLIGSLAVKYRDGRRLQVVTDKTWQTAMKAGGKWTAEVAAAAPWTAAMELGPLGMAPWGIVEPTQTSPHLFPEIAVVDRLMDRIGVQADFSYQTSRSTRSLRYIHRRLEGGDLYFVANRDQQPTEAVCCFRVHGRPELWWPETGRIESAAVYDETHGGTRLPIRLESSGSVFVVFRDGAAVEPERVVSVTRDGQPILPAPASAAKRIVIQKARYGVLNDPKRTIDVRARVQSLVDHGQTAFGVAEMAEGGDPAFNVVKSLTIDYTVDGQPRHASGRDPETINLLETTAAQHFADVRGGADGKFVLEAWEKGNYQLTMSSGKKLTVEVASLPPPLPIGGPWEVQFPPKLGAPEKIVLEKPISWSEHGDPGVKYFSGTATYRTSFNLPADWLSSNRKLSLDLGRVEVMAEVTLNGQPLGLLWKSPYRVDISGAARSGENTLELKVTNLWINRMIGDEQLPEDSDRNPNGTLKAWPKWLQQHKPSPTGRYTFTSWRLWKKGAPLVESGLLGPVTLKVAERIAVRP